MKNLLKKFGVMIASLMLVMTTFAMPSFAEPQQAVTITGLEKGVTATAYKIGGVNAKGEIERIKGVDKTVIKNLEQPESGEIVALASKLPATTGDLKDLAVLNLGTAGDNGTVTKATTAADRGIYLVKFGIGTGANPDYVYNPVIISVDKDGKAEAFANSDGKKYDWGDTAQVKKSKVPFDKVVERTLDKIDGTDKGSNTENGKTKNDGEEGYTGAVNGGNRGDTAGRGDTVSFRINTQIPAYEKHFFKKNVGGEVPNDTEDFNNPGFKIHDTFNGLTLTGTTGTENIEVYAIEGDTETLLTPGANGAYTVTAKANKAGFDIVFTDKGVFDNRGKKIEVRYSATVNNNAATTNFNPDTNKAECEYTRAPGEEPSQGEMRTTYHYKFTINGQINGNSGEWNREVIKVGTDESGDQILMETTNGQMTEKGWQPLDGVFFKLHKDNNGQPGDVVRGADRQNNPVVSADGGVIKGMDQLDAGVYWLVEDEDQPQFEAGGDYAANKYKPNTNPIKIEIRANLRDDGRLDSYMVLVADNVVGHYKAAYTNNYTKDKGTMGIDHAGTFYEIADQGGVTTANTTEVGTGVKIEQHHNVQKPKDDGTFEPLTGNWKEDYGIAADIRNTKIGTLPSTGGMGTIMFTIGGIVIMALALFLLFGGRKRQAQK